MALAELAVSRPASIIELAAAASRKGYALGKLRGKQTVKNYISLKDIMGDIRRLRSFDLLQILKERSSLRQMDPDAKPVSEITLVRFPGEEYTEVSQTRVLFSFPGSDPPMETMGSGLDLLARSAGSIDARDALDLIGDPDAIEDESVGRFVKRTHEEIRVSERRFRVAREIGDRQQMARSDEIRDSLVERLLNLRGGKNFLIKCFELLNNGSSKIAIMTSKDSITIVPETPKLRDLVLKGGGWDRVIDTSQMEHSDLLSELS